MCDVLLPPAVNSIAVMYIAAMEAEIEPKRNVILQAECLQFSIDRKHTFGVFSAYVESGISEVS
jgi:hypothetical protein